MKPDLSCPARPSPMMVARCGAKCEHMVQQPETDQDVAEPIISPAEEDTIPDIHVPDDSVRSDNADEDKPQNRYVQAVKNEIVTGYKSILLGLFIVLFGYWIYLALSPGIIMGQGLTFNNVEITREGGTMRVRGEIVNTMNEMRGVPSITITTMFADVAGDTVVYKPPIEGLGAGTSAQIDYQIGEYSADITDLRIGFKAPESGN